jgi:hypothetical protein
LICLPKHSEGSFKTVKPHEHTQKGYQSMYFVILRTCKVIKLYKAQGERWERRDRRQETGEVGDGSNEVRGGRWETKREAGGTRRETGDGR